MLITSEFDVAVPPGRVWEFFGDIPRVAACLPGAELTDNLDKLPGQLSIWRLVWPADPLQGQVPVPHQAEHLRQACVQAFILTAGPWVVVDHDAPPLSSSRHCGKQDGIGHEA